MAQLYFRCTKDIPVKDAPTLKHFTNGKVYTGRKAEFEEEYRIWDNFKEPRFVFGEWVEEHFDILGEKPTQAMPGTKEIKVWTNGNAIRKYTGQDNREDYRPRKGSWYVAKAVLVPWEENQAE